MGSPTYFFLKNQNNVTSKKSTILFYRRALVIFSLSFVLNLQHDRCEGRTHAKLFMYYTSSFSTEIGLLN